MSEIINSFPGYEYQFWEEGKLYLDGEKGNNRYHNVYRNTDIGYGGRIMSNPNVAYNVACLDVESMHPHSAICLNYFGEYTYRFKAIVDARLAIKHGDLDKALEVLSQLVDKETLKLYLSDQEKADGLAQALKIAINSVYGLTSASFDNPFRNPKNVNNIVALRGALFMRTLEDEVTKRGFDILAVKTDSIKIINATPEIIKYCMEFANKYGYKFEHESTYERICQINDADFIAKYASADECEKAYGYIPKDNKKKSEKWTATGKMFQIPYVFKKLTGNDNDINVSDFCIAFSVKTSLHLDMNEELPDDEHNYIFVGRVGGFTPIKPGKGGGLLLRKRDENSYTYATGAKGYRWFEYEDLLALSKEEDVDNFIDLSYFETLKQKALNEIAKYEDPFIFLCDMK